MVLIGAFVCFGPIQTREIVAGGIFNLGFIAMPLVINTMACSALFGFLWFFLLFLAAITSSISLALPAIAFIEDEFNMSRKKAVMIFGLVSLIIAHMSVLFLKHGVVDEFDFWGGTFTPVVCALIETILCVWIFHIDKTWEEMHYGADITIPRFYKFIMKYITPSFLFIILVVWSIQKGWPVVAMEGVAAADKPYILSARIVLIALALSIGFGIQFAWKRRTRKGLR